MNMYLDIETACQPWETLPEHRAEYFQEQLEKRIAQDFEGDVEEAWMEIAPRKPEWGILACVSYAIGNTGVKCLRWSDWSEQDLDTDDIDFNEETLTQENHILKSLEEDLYAQPSVTLVSHNGKGFDWPFLCRKYLQNGLCVPRCLRIHDKKPWEITHVDTMELMAFGNSFHNKISLENACHILDVPTPKGGAVKAAEVPRAFLAGRIKDIAAYCNRDVVALREVFQKLSERLGGIGA